MGKVGSEILATVGRHPLPVRKVTDAPWKNCPTDTARP